MDVESLSAMRAQRLYDRRPDGDVGHEMPIHHIDMDPITPSLVYRAHFAFIRNPILSSDGVNTPALFGFTNTLLWADPEREMSAALCTTGKSVHPVALGAFANMIGTISTAIPRSARVG